MSKSGTPRGGLGAMQSRSRSLHARHRLPTLVRHPPKTCCDQFRPWLYLYNYKASYFSL
jgi:hypothetical protein